MIDRLPCLELSRRANGIRHAGCARLLFMILMVLSLVANAAPKTLGQDIPYAVLTDANGTLSLHEAVQALEGLAATQTEALSRGYVRDIFWLGFQLPASDFDQQDRWLELGPNFVDDIRLFYRLKGTDQHWQSRQAGDVLPGKADLDYPSPVFVIPPPPEGSAYEVILRVQSTSSVMLQAAFWKPAEFLGYAARNTSFWSFYFGLAAIATLLALVLAIILQSRLLWLVTAFSSTYLLVASIQGYVSWVFNDINVPLQHYSTSALMLISFALLMLLCSETIDLRRHMPWAHKILVTGCGLTLSLLLLIPLDHYALAIKIKSAIFVVTSAVFIYSVFYLWVRDRFRPSMLLLGASPMVCTIASLSGLLSALGWIPFRDEIYVVWQYALVVNMLLVMAVAVYRVREKQLEELEKQQLVKELRVEREASFHQRQFMGMVAHEFRTPLAVISGTLENLYHLEGRGQNGRTSRYAKVQRATDRLVQLTDNCLADARLAANALYLEAQPANLLELISSAASLVQLSDSHQLLLTIQGHPVDKSSPVYTVSVDPALIRIALSNIIDNAVKYSHEGLIHIDCGKEGRRTAIRISDQGSGIDEQVAEQIFERYRRATGSGQGAGLGLYVARQIAQAHGGDLRLVCSSSQGSCFEFTLHNGKAAAT
ncbi:sensor histidine kinase [Stutzerimonas nitrititolerans]|uniref:sensor histidine kinase n=1 Tax=Stutzerimonas nitrititolerans TaxID=2482751 RepID=UPI00289A2312|nr:ATP-binding protein [Stutzerimonas nitrititolerans]